MDRIMVTTVYQSTENSTGNDAINALSQDSILHAANTAVEPNAQLKLTTLLQTTLKLEPLFDLFFGQLQHLLKINSCCYVFPEKNVDLKLGKITTHTTEYSLNLHNEVLGTIIFSRKQRFAESELLHLESLLGILVYPLRNAIHYRDAIQQALSDPLTGLGNRGALETAIQHEWQMSQRYDQDFCVLMIDIDHFKNINDTYGHATGDKVLKEVASSIIATTRQTDVAYRYGGEEFVVILNKSNLLGAMIIAERIRENIAALKISAGKDKDKYLSLTISIGGSCSATCKTSEEMMEQADKVLYLAKHNGRNRVEFPENDQQSHTKRNLSIDQQ